jgi:hypothetical protein
MTKRERSPDLNGQDPEILESSTVKTNIESLIWAFEGCKCISPKALDIMRLHFGEEVAQKLAHLPLSDNCFSFEVNFFYHACRGVDVEKELKVRGILGIDLIRRKLVEFSTTPQLHYDEGFLRSVFEFVTAE